ncbi:MAG: TRAP transporter fused permease subunit [Burkholderiales bacterium]|nr:TRAP transporter fused permease subunit [Burkholderiales bacterium]
MSEGQRRYSAFRRFAENALGVLITGLGLVAILDLPMQVAGISVFPQQYLGAFWGLVTCLAFITCRASAQGEGGTPGPTPWYDYVLAAVSLVLGLYVAFWYPSIMDTIGLLSPDRTLLGVLAIAVVLESTRRVAGWPLVAIVVVFVLYGRFGDMFPGPLATTGLSWERLVNLLFLGTDALFGSALRIAVLLVFAFILFGQVLFATGGGDIFLKLAQATMGRYRGGPAKMAVVASGMFGSISGSAVANVASTGVITIPLMKRTGYSPTFAGAVEAVASTGGAIMPPVMGAAAFLMTEFLGIPYSAVVLAAFVPALIYYGTLLVQIDLRAIRERLRGLPRDDLPPVRPVLREGWVFLLPLVVLVGTIFFLNTEAAEAALYAVASNIVLVLLRRRGWRALTPRRLLALSVELAHSMVQITVICAAAGFIVGLVAYTGLGVSLADVLVQFAGHNLLLLALCTALASTVLGMGMPATACYILVAVLMAPALVSAGVQPLLAHLFVFYFGNFSFLTPPVALAVTAACSIASAPFLATCWQSIRLALAGFIAPFMFLYKPGMALMGSPGDVAWAIFDSAVAVVLLAVAVEGYWYRRLAWWARCLVGAAALLMFVPGWETRIAGLVLGPSILYLEYRRSLSSARYQTAQ